MEILLWIIAIWFIWGVIKHMAKGRGIVNALTNVRISALKNPSRYLGDLDLNYATEDEVKEGIAGLLILALTAKGYNLSDYIPGNIEVTTTFYNTVNDVYDAIKKEFDTRKKNYDDEIPYIDIDDEIPF